MKKLAMSVALLGLIGAGMALAGDAPGGLRRTELQRAPVPNGKYVTVVVRAEVDKGAATGWHTHPGDEITVVASGSITLQITGQPDKVLKTGNSVRIPAGTPHNGTAGADGFVATGIYVVEADKPLASPAAP